MAHCGDIAIERATLHDVDTVLPMFESYRGFYHRPPRPDEARQFIARRLALCDATILIARAAGEAVGFVQLFRGLSSLGLSNVCIVNDLYVRPEYRGRGVARLLMSSAPRVARESDAVRLTLETSPANVAARRLYESLGYMLERDMMHYALEL